MSLTESTHVEHFADQFPNLGRLLGLDLGTKTIGLAISDSQWTIASPIETIRRNKFTQDAHHLVELVEKEQITGLVLGLPLNMDGSEGPRAQSTRAFHRNLQKFLTLPTLLWDERLSSFAADQTMLEADLSRAKRQKHIDQLAAAIILQGALDRLNRDR